MKINEYILKITCEKELWENHMQMNESYFYSHFFVHKKKNMSKLMVYRDKKCDK